MWCPTSRRARRNIAILIERNGTNCIASMCKSLPDLECIVDRNHLPPRQLTRYDKDSRRATFDSMRISESPRSITNQENMLALHDPPGQSDRMTDALYSSDTARSKRRAIH
jgi:hypothetical protein